MKGSKERELRVSSPSLLVVDFPCLHTDFFYFQKSPFTEDTLSGVTGAHVASDAVEELNNVLVPAQIPDRKTEEEAAASWDPKQKQEFVTSVGVKVNLLNSFSLVQATVHTLKRGL